MQRIRHFYCFSVIVATVAVVTLFGPPVENSSYAADPGVEAALNLQNAFTKIAEDASDAVVVVTNKQVNRSPRSMQQIPPEFRFFFGLPEQREDQEREYEEVPRPAGRGSGFFIDEAGYIVTNYHVIKDHVALEVKLRDGKVYDTERNEDSIEVIGSDRETDLAVLKINDPEREDDFPVLEFADSKQIKVGQWAIAVGAPFNFDRSITVGVVSQKGRHDMRVNTYENYIQTDASINPGNSGGPLLDLHGRVVGVNDFIVTGGGMSRGNVGLGFAIASNLAKQVVDDIIEYGSVSRPWIGIAMQPLTQDLKDQFGVENGVLVSDVMQDDPAQKAGVEAGDIIVKVGKKQVDSPHDLQFAILKYGPGEEIPITLIRDGNKKTINVTAREREPKATAQGEAESREDVRAQLGMDLQNTERGVVVARVASGSKADAAHLQRGDIIHEVNKEEVKTVQDVWQTLESVKGNIAVLYVERQGNKFFVPLRLENGK